MAPTTTRTDAKNWTTMTEGEVMDADGTESAAVTSSPPPKKRRKLGCVRFSELVVEFAAPGGHKPFTAEEPKQNFYTVSSVSVFCHFLCVLSSNGDRCYHYLPYLFSILILNVRFLPIVPDFAIEGRLSPFQERMPVRAGAAQNGVQVCTQVR